MKRRVTTILASDVVSFSRLVAENEDDTLRRLTAYHRAFETFVARHGGRIFNTAGDSIMCEFDTPLKAVQTAIDVQEAIRARNLAYPPNRWLQFRIGICMGEVVDRGSDVLGMAVNLAARLEKLARPGGVCVSRDVHEAVAGQVPVPFVDWGARQLRNIPKPVHTFAIAWPGTDVEPEPSGKRARRHGLWGAGIAAAALLIGAALAVGVWRFPGPEGQPESDLISASPAQQAAEVLVHSANPAATFAKLSQKGGLIEDTKSAPGLYYKALLFEAKGETSGAHRAYYALARMGLEFIDPHLRYANLVRLHEGRPVVRQVYAELHEDAPTRATELVHALELDRQERLAKLKGLIAEHPDFAPAYYFLAEEHSEERLGSRQTLNDKRIELAALVEFLKADQEGRLAGFFLDRTIASAWLDKAQKRRAKLEPLLGTASAAPKASLE